MEVMCMLGVVTLCMELCATSPLSWGVGVRPPYSFFRGEEATLTCFILWSQSGVNPICDALTALRG